MKPAPFDYHRPDTIDETLDMLSTLANARVLAGGQSLMPILNMRLASVDHVVDINRVAGLNDIDLDAVRVRIGATVRQAALLQHAGLRRHDPILAEALAHVGHLATRARGTAGGSLAHMDPAAELMGVAAVHDAVIRLRSKDQLRSVPIADYAVDLLTPDIRPGELLLDIAWDLWPLAHGACFLEFAHRHGDFAIVGVAALLLLADDGTAIQRAALALIGVDKAPIRLREAEAMMVGAPPAAAVWREVAELAGRIEPISDAMATRQYRQRLARVLTERALKTACDRALAKAIAA